MSADGGRTRVAVVLGAAAVLMLTLAGAQFSGATLSATASNPGNSFTGSTYYGFFASGYYTGNAADNRAITAVGFRPDVVIVKGNTTQTAAIRTSTMNGDVAKPMAGATAQLADVIQSLDANGFTVGLNGRVNTAGVGYEWMAFRAQQGLLKVGTYTGNGTSQSVTGLGFSPEYSAVFSAGANNAVQRYSGGTTSFQFDGDTGNATRITALDADGFSVGAQDTVNANGTTYNWIAFNDAAGVVDINGYTGDNTDNRNITGVGFQPEYVIARANDTATARLGAHRPATLPGDTTLRYGALVNATNSLQALQADGFQVGTDTSVNANTVGYRYLAVRDTASSDGSGCPNSGSQLVTPVADTYVDENAPTANFGGGASLLLRSRFNNKNQRALVRFNLPSIPAGCSLTGASLKLFASAFDPGRTIDVFRAGGAWAEGTVDWNTAPATAGAATSRTSAAGNLYWDTTAQVQAMYSGTNNGFVVRDRTESAPGPGAQQTYQAREGTPDTQDPELRVSWG